MVRADSAIVFDFLNTTATTEGISLFKLGNSTTVSTQNNVWRGEGFVPASVYSYSLGRFEAIGVGLQFTYSSGATSVLYNISGSDINGLETTPSINLGGTLTIVPGASPSQPWLWTWVNPSQGIQNIGLFLFAVRQSDINISNVGSEEITSNGVAISGNIPYSYVLESQIGAPIKIYAIDIQCEDNRQILEPLTYTREDSNGNGITHQCIPTIDPYQDQTGVILNKKVKGFILDGETSLSFNLQPNVSFRLILNYLSLKNADLFRGALRQELAVERMRLLGSLGATPGQKIIIG